MKRSRRRTFRRSKRSKVDVVPFSVCAQGLPLPTPAPDGAVTCENPVKFFLPIADGGALNQILRLTSTMAGHQELYQPSQSVTKGISFLGSTFDCRLSFLDDVPNFSQAGPAGLFAMRVRGAIHRVEMTRDPLTNERLPLEIPNLFSGDEQDVNDVLYRWDMRLWLGWTDAQAQIWQSSTDGSLAYLYSATENQNFFELGSGANSKLHHHVRNRRFLDEEHAIGFVFCVEYDSAALNQVDSFNISLDMFGINKLRTR